MCLELFFRELLKFIVNSECLAHFSDQRSHSFKKLTDPKHINKQKVDEVYRRVPISRLDFDQNPQYYNHHVDGAQNKRKVYDEVEKVRRYFRYQAGPFDQCTNIIKVVKTAFIAVIA